MTRILFIHFFSLLFPFLLSAHPPSYLSTANVTCTENSSFPCLLNNLTFPPVASLDPLEDINEFIESSYMFKKKFTLVPQESPLKGYRMKLRDDFEANETLMVYFNEEEVLHDRSLGRAYFSKHPDMDLHANLPPLNISDPTCSLALTLLVHLYYPEYSKFSADLALLDRNLDPPLLNFNNYEQLLMRKENLYKLMTYYRDSMVQTWKNTVKQMNERWDDEERKSFLRGRPELPFQDFIYSYIVVSSGAYMVSDGTKTKAFICPVLHHLAFGDRIYEKTGIFNKFLTTRNLFGTKIQLRQSFPEGTELLNDIPEVKSESLFIFNSHFPLRSDFDCIKLRVFPEYVAKDWMKNHSSGEHCINRDRKALRNFHVVIVQMNQQPEEREKCNMVISKLKDLKPEDKQEFFFKKCPFTSYGNDDVWNRTINDVIEDEMRKNFEKKIVNTKKYLEKRKENNLGPNNGLIILKYWENRLKLLDDIKEQILELRQMSITNGKKLREEEGKRREKATKKKEDPNPFIGERKFEF